MKCYACHYESEKFIELDMSVEVCNNHADVDIGYLRPDAKTYSYYDREMFVILYACPNCGTVKIQR